MSSLQQLGAVLKKSYLLKSKTPISTLAELLLPVAILAILVALRSEMDSSTVLELFQITLFLCYSSTLSKLSHLIVTEREQRIAEMMKILGLSSWIFYSSWFIAYALIMTVLSFIMAPLLVYGKILENASMTVVLTVLILYSLSSVAFTMFLSVPFDSAKAAQSVTFLIYYITQFMRYLMKDWSDPAIQAVRFLFPSLNLADTLNTMSIMERMQYPLSWSENLKYKFPHDVSSCMMFFGLSTVAYFVLYAYLDQVVPRSVGTRKHFLFFLMYLKKSLSSDRLEADGSESLGLVAGEELKVRTFGLTKKYDRVALGDVNVEFASGELTVLLGRNGAGKTTLINILTGMAEPTKGTAMVLGHSILREMDVIRKNLGFCPQHDIQWPQLSVEEHFEIFGKIRGMSRELIQERSARLITSLGLVGKERAKVSELSGGMKRKLSVALCFLGDPKFVILDEPTSGLDPLSRRHMWEILGKLREDRVMLLSTHYMDEAEVLGERIVILSEGSVKANGTVNELKLQYNCGYEIGLYVIPGAPLDFVEDLTHLVEDRIRGARIQATRNHISVSVPIDSGAELPNLLASIRMRFSEKLEMKIDIVSKRLEEVFMKVSMEDGNLEELILPLSGDEEDIDSAPLTESEDNGTPPAKVRRGKRVEIEYYTSGLDMFRSQVIGTILKRIRMLIREKRTNFVQYLFPLIMLAMGIWVRQVVVDSSGGGTLGSARTVSSSKDVEKAAFEFPAADMIMVVFVQIALTSVSSNIVGNLTRENVSQSKFLQFVAGLGPSAYWTGSFAMDALEYYVFPFMFTVVMVSIAKMTISTMPLFALLGVYGPAIIAQTYLVSVVLPNDAVGRIVSLLLNTVFGMIMPIVVIGLVTAKKGGDWTPIVTVVLHVFPSFNLGYGIFVWLLHSVFDSLLGKGPGGRSMLSAMPRDIRNSLPKYLTAESVYCFEVLGGPIMCCIGAAVVMFAATIIVDRLVYAHKFTRTIGMDARDSLRPIHGLESDESVDQERLKAKNPDAKYILRVDSVSKKYARYGRPAVSRVPLAVCRNGEIFSVLGENGAGKTTLVKMAIGELLPSQGDVYIGELNSKQELNKFRQLIGYCPQFDALTLQMTVKDHLRLYARIKGVKPACIDAAVSQIVNWLGLGQYINRKARGLSGGYRRRLSLAIALMGEPSIVFLDEPSCGMDPVARRQMWTVMESASRRCAIVLTTHSMEEAESVSTRLGIMSKGRMICLGTASQLREKYSNGLEVFVQAASISPEAIRAYDDFADRILACKQPFVQVAAQHSEKRKQRFLTSGMSLIGKALSGRPDPVLVPAFVEWWVQEDLFDSIQNEVTRRLEGVTAFEASGRSVRFVVSPKIVDFDLVESVFALLSELKSRNQVTDYSLTLNSLDQVFRSIASRELEYDSLALDA